jgi:predicted Fe-Mo cluster-binding NifX family protein
MRIAVPDWEGYVSPVLDKAGRIRLAEMREEAILAWDTVVLGAGDPTSRALQLAKLDVDVLICCSVSHALEAALVSRGVRVVRHICGPVTEVVNACLSGGVIPKNLIMPGCRERNREWESPHG